jgi:hypothetical protein
MQLLLMLSRINYANFSQSKISNAKISCVSRRMRLFRRRLSDVSLSSPDKEDEWQTVKAVPALVLEDCPPKKGEHVL